MVIFYWVLFKCLELVFVYEVHFFVCLYSSLLIIMIVLPLPAFTTIRLFGVNLFLVCLIM